MLAAPSRTLITLFVFTASISQVVAQSSPQIISVESMASHQSVTDDMGIDMELGVGNTNIEPRIQDVNGLGLTYLSVKFDNSMSNTLDNTDVTPCGGLGGATATASVDPSDSTVVLITYDQEVGNGMCYTFRLEGLPATDGGILGSAGEDSDFLVCYLEADADQDRNVGPSDETKVELTGNLGPVESATDGPVVDLDRDGTVGPADSTVVQQSITNAIVTNPECDDGVFCNGVETCNSGTCVAGNAPCSDSDQPFCNESEQTCETDPNLGGFQQNFNSFADGSDPLNWLDTGGNNSTSEDDGLFKVQTVGGDKVFATSSTLVNIHSHYLGAGSDIWAGYVFTGRMKAVSSTGGVGVTFLSQYPDLDPFNSDKYYRLREFDGGSFHISPHGTDLNINSVSMDSGVSLIADTWFYFHIEVTDTGTQTEIRAKVWAEGSNVPSDWQIDCYDDSGSRLTTGRIGVWSMAAGDKYWDDFDVSFPSCALDCDGDGEPDCSDGCPTDPLKQAPGECGCGNSDADSDSDGVPDCLDLCPGQPDVDSDGDETIDCNDGCPADPLKQAPGECGCGVSDDDSDGDGVADCNDVCPGFDDNFDTDGDGTPNGCEPCVTNTDCNDGTFCNGEETCCNGEETCQSGSCVAATSPCVLNEVCVESAGICDPNVWQAPIGIPEPSFGIRETVATAYGSDTHYTHWVDNTHPNRTDVNNNGMPSMPRESIPFPLPAGSVVELRGGPYDISLGDPWQFTANGTVKQPVFIRGPRVGALPEITTGVRFLGEYLIVENLKINGGNGLFTQSGVHHVAVRDCEFIGGGGAGIRFTGPDGSTIHDIVILNCSIHDWGNWQSDDGIDRDYHGIQVGIRTNNIWILDNEMYHNEGDGVQINAGCGNWSLTHHIYLGRNEAWENKQTGFWSKEASDVIMSENIVHDITPSDSSGHGAGMGGQYAPHPIWYLNNEIYACDSGFALMSERECGAFGHSYFIGNTVHDLTDSDNTFDPNNAWENAAFILAGTVHRHVINNTVYNVPAGINCSRTFGSYEIANNIISNTNEPGGKHVFLADPGALVGSSLTHCLFYQNGSDIGVQWANDYYSTPDDFPNEFLGSFDSDPLFVDPNTDDYSLQAGSPAIGAGSKSAQDAVYAEFFALYGLSIDPGEMVADIGAHIYFVDCNANGVNDRDDISSGVSADLNGNSVPDECDDCNANGVADHFDITFGISENCNGNYDPDECDIASGASSDCDGNGIPDECDQDWDSDGQPDACQYAGTVTVNIELIGSGTPPAPFARTATFRFSSTQPIAEQSTVLSVVYDTSGHAEVVFNHINTGHDSISADGCNSLRAIKALSFDMDDEAEVDFTGASGFVQGDISGKLSASDNALTAIDQSTLLLKYSPEGVLVPLGGCGTGDLWVDGVVDSHDLFALQQSFGSQLQLAGFAPNAQKVALTTRFSEADCNSNGVEDWIDINSTGTSADCDLNGIPDECDIAEGADDCNSNSVPDSCDIAEATSNDCDTNGVPDECQDPTPTGAEFVAIQSMATHTGIASELGIDVDPTDFEINVEPRVTDVGGLGIVSLRMQFNKAMDIDAPGVDVTPTDCNALGGATATATLDPSDSNVVVITFDQAPANVGCTVFDLDGLSAADGCTFGSGPEDTDFSICYLEGDVSGDGIVNTFDFSEIAWPANLNKAADEAVSGPSVDLDRSGTVDVSDREVVQEFENIWQNVPTSGDCNSNGVPDECESDCNDNQIADACDISAATSSDCDTNGVPDECQPDCNGNQIADACDITSGTSANCNRNRVPDSCELSEFNGFALSFDGNGDHVMIPSNTDLRPSTDFTVEAWVKPKTIGNNMTILRHDDDGGNDDGYLLRISPSGNAVFAARNNNTLANQNVTSSQALSAGAWAHVAGVYDPPNILVYVDGVATSESNAADDVRYDLTSQASLNIGRRGGNETPYSIFFDGDIDEVRIWDTVQSQAQIQANMGLELKGIEVGLVGYWKFDEGSGQGSLTLPSTTTAYDSAGDQDGTLMFDTHRVPTTRDCNTNSIPDVCDITSGTAMDVNTNGIPDTCDNP